MEFGRLLYCRAKDAKTGAWVTGYYYEQPVVGCIGPIPDPLHFIMECCRRLEPACCGQACAG